jgi:hypothetical protein
LSGFIPSTNCAQPGLILLEEILKKNEGAAKDYAAPSLALWRTGVLDVLQRFVLAPFHRGSTHSFFLVVRVADKLEGKCCDSGDDNQCNEEQHGLSPLLSLTVKILTNNLFKHTAKLTINATI